MARGRRGGTVSDLRRWLGELGLERYVGAFERNDMEAEDVAELSDEDLVDLGLSLGHRRRVLKAIREGRVPEPPPDLAGGPEGERRHATVLFADVEGFTALSERIDPESVHTLMEGCFAILRERIRRYDGRVTQYAGDGTMALFGAPVAQEDHAARAAHAALDIQASLAGYAEEVEARLGRPFRMRIGLNSGLVVVGHLGDDKRMDYTAIGDTVNLAARLEQIAPPGQVYASEGTCRLARGQFEWEDQGSQPVRGRSAPVRVYRLVGRTGAHTVRPQATAELSPLVGRQHELGVLTDAWENVIEGCGRIVSIVGEAGLGKSRLLVEFARELEGTDARIVEGTCFTYGDQTSFMPFLRIVRELCAVAESDPEPAAKDAIGARLAELGLTAETTAPYLHHLLSYQVDDDVFPYLTPELVRRRTGVALRALLTAEARVKPLAVVIEDVHWIDKATEEVIGALVDDLGDRRILLALAYRPEYLNQWRDRRLHDEIHLHPLPDPSRSALVRSILAKPYAAHLQLEPLSAGQALAIAQRILGEDAVSPELERLIIDRTEGNPLFVEELTQALIEGGAVARNEGTIRLSRPADELEIPPNLQGVLLARIDRLPKDVRTTLRLAATIGRVFSPEVLRAASPDASSVPAHLEQLERLDFVRRAAPGPSGDYSFKHVLTQESVYATLVSRARSSCHEAVARAIEELHHERLEEYAEVLARHYDEAGRGDKAVEFLVTANRKAMRSNAVAEAYQSLARAFELLEQLPQTPEHRSTHVRLLCDNVIVFQLLFRYEEYYRRLLDALPVAAAVSPELEGMVLNRLAHMEWAMCDLPTARTRNARAVTIWAHEDQPEELAYASMIGGYVALVAGEFATIEHSERLSLQALERGFNLRWHVWTSSFASLGYSWMGRFAEAVERGARALSVAEEYDDDSLVCFASWVLGLAHACRGELARALEFGARAVDVAPTPSDRSWAASTHAWFLARAGAIDEAIPILEECVAANRAARFIWSEVMATYLAEAYLLAGRLDQARTTVDEVSAYCTGNGMEFFAGVADRLRGEVELAADRGPEADQAARDAFGRAIATLRRIGGEAELARALAGLGRLERDRGDAARAADLIDEATAIHRRLGSLEPASENVHLPGPL
jgi:class 3 adenylate cyclase/tetratricopeptide (TPR) repeat protein